MNNRKDRVCLAEGYSFPVDQNITGINENSIIVGPTRSGKTMSVVEPKLLHTYDTSLIISVTKRGLVTKYAKLFSERGYQVWDLNMVDPGKCNIAYDPFDFVNSDQEVLNLARTIIGSDVSRSHEGNVDPYWNEAATSALAALIDLTIIKAKRAKRKATLKDFYNIYTSLRFTGNEFSIKSPAMTSLDHEFEEIEKRNPKAMCCRLWKTMTDNAPKTAACIYSMVNSAVNQLITPSIMKMMNVKKHVSFKTMGTQKTVLFLTTSPVNKSMQKFSAMFFSDAFRCLFEYAETCDLGELPVPVHLICDDFASGCRITDFHEYISVFCAKGISTTLLLQSESQLESMYGKMEATTIINNCDTYLYMGGMDNTTCYNISRRRNIPIEDVYAMPLERVMLFRRGAKPVTARRYQTLNDPLYLSVMNMQNTMAG